MNTKQPNSFKQLRVNIEINRNYEALKNKTNIKYCMHIIQWDKGSKIKRKYQRSKNFLLQSQ